MQKLFLGLPIALTVACGQLNRPTTTSPPKARALPYESKGELYAATRPVPDERPKTPSAKAPAAGGRARNLSTIGDFVRTRTAQMNFCYQEALATDPKLAGAIAVAVTITSSGDVTQADVIKRSWSGRGSEEMESCVRARVSTWKFPPSDAPTGTYPVSLSFTK